MVNRIPEYLKLFVDEETKKAEQEPSLPQIARLCRILPEVTGLKLDVVERPSDQQLAFPWSSPFQSSFKVSLGSTSRAPRSSLAELREFEEALSALFGSFADTRYQLQRREAELAAAVPVVSVESDEKHLSDRLLHVLRGTADMTQCTAAGLYMLDEATTALKLRASYGMGQEALLLPARRLEDANADVEALAGHAVVIEDTQTPSCWEPPHPCRAALCVPVSTANTILGTLWFYRDAPADFSVEDQNLIEITAGRIASDLERAVLMQEVKTLRAETRKAAQRPASMSNASVAPNKLRRQGRVTPTIPDWEIATGVTEEHREIDFCDWYEASGERLHLTVGAPRSVDNPTDAALVAQSIHAAHVRHAPDLQELIGLTNDSLWQSSPEGEEVDFFHGVLDPTCGRLTYEISGDIQAYIIRPHAWEPLLANGKALGVDDVTGLSGAKTVQRQMLMPGDILFATSLRPEAGQANQIAEILLRHFHLPADELARQAVHELRKWASPTESKVVLLAKRDESV